ncbi:MAG: EF-P lysine aminoacylase GenX, partial [Deltaproteobacteria bacterium]
FSPAAIRRAMRDAGIWFSDDDEPDDLINRIMVERVEPELAGLSAVFITEYPAFMAALARLHPERPQVAERFELYLGGVEIANGYDELCDPGEQRLRFEQQRQLRRRMGRYVPRVDEAFLHALVRGVPDCCGCALGVDRLLMVLLGARDIGEVMPFSLEQELALRRMLEKETAR